MSKALMIPLHPKHCEQLALGISVNVVWKELPNMNIPCKCYVYQTKRRWKYDTLKSLGKNDLFWILSSSKYKVVGEFILNGYEFFNEKTVVLHVENVKLYERAKELYEFVKWNKPKLKLKVSPRRFMYVEELKK